MCPVCKVLDCKECSLLLRRLIDPALKISLHAIYDDFYYIFRVFIVSCLALCIDNLAIRHTKKR